MPKSAHLLLLPFVSPLPFVGCADVPISTEETAAGSPAVETPTLDGTHSAVDVQPHIEPEPTEPRPPRELSPGPQPTPPLPPEWAHAGQVPTTAWQLAASDDRILVFSEDGLFEHQDGAWTSLHDRFGTVTGVNAVDGAVAVTTAEGLFVRESGASSFERIHAVGEGHTFVVGGDAGLFSSDTAFDRAWQVWPELRDVGPSIETLFSSCGTQVQDGRLEMFSLHLGEWLDLPLPNPTAHIFEFAATDTERWVFGHRSLWKASAEGTDWTDEVHLPELSFHMGVSQHGDVIFTQTDGTVGWTTDGGEHWSLLDAIGLSLWTPSHNQLFYIPPSTARHTPAFQEDSVIRSRSLYDGPESDHIVAELPPAPVFMPRLTQDGAAVLTSRRGTSLHDGEETTYIGGVPGMLLHDMLPADGDRPGIWIVTTGEPAFQDLESGLYHRGAMGWPSWQYDATSIVQTPDGLMACTGSMSGHQPHGAGVWGRAEIDGDWVEIGMDFPREGAHPALCSGIFYAENTLVVSTTAGISKLDPHGRWQPVAGLDGLFALMDSPLGQWALTPDGLLFSDDGSEFTVVDPTGADIEKMGSLDDELVVLRDGTLFTGIPGDWTAHPVGDDEDVLDFDVRDSQILAVTDGSRAVLLSME